MQKKWFLIIGGIIILAVFIPILYVTIQNYPDEPIVEKNPYYCKANQDCTYYKLYDCVYAINKNHPNAETNVNKGPPPMAAHCLEANFFNYVCEENNCAKENNCETVCNLNNYDKNMLTVIQQEDCPATSQVCNIYKNCEC
jgi:hypothetical protein